MRNDAKFDVFLCYNSEDEDAVIEIAEQLKSRGLRPLLDQWDLTPGRPWQSELERQIGQIATAAVFVGETGIGPWQQQEIYSFLNELVNRGCPVIPVLLANAPEQPELSIFLKNNTWVDFRRQQPDPMDRLIWGVTGKNPAPKQKTVERNRPSSQISVQERTGSATSEIQEPVPIELELEKAKVINYGKLQDLLAAEKWREADEETSRLMLVVAKREEEGWLDRSSIERFPCEHLRNIDKLWIKYSDRRFGFSVQQKIWEEVGGTPKADNDTFRHFCNQVQWRIRGDWNHYSHLKFTSDAPLGHLPAGLCGEKLVIAMYSEWVWLRGGEKYISSLAQRLVTCSIQESN